MELDILCSLIHDNVSYVMAAQEHNMTPVRAPEVKEAAASVETEPELEYYCSPDNFYQ